MPGELLSTPAPVSNGKLDTTKSNGISSEQNDSTSSSILHTSLASSPPKIISADGNYLTTSTGHQIFDATGGAAVACIGHNHPSPKAAITSQLATGLAYTYAPFFTTDASEQLAAYLTESTNGAMSKTFIVSSGTETIEAALKLSRQYFLELEGPSTQRSHFIARQQSYHGNTLGSLSVGGHKARREIYEPLLMRGKVSWMSPCYPYRGMRGEEGEEEYVGNLVRELEGEFERAGSGRVCAVVLETVAGLTLGAVPPAKGYLKKVKQVCERHGALLILDEVMSGMGRTGTLHAWEQENVVPDLQTVAKGLGAGYQPIGALLISKRIISVLSHGSNSFIHSQTYQGHPVACAAALAVQQVILSEKLLENVQSLGPYLYSLLEKRLGGHKNVGQIRGRGFLWAIEFVQDKATKTPFPASEKIAARIHGLGLTPEFGISLLPGSGVADGVNGDVIMLAPAYNVTREEIELIVERTTKVVEAVLGS